MGALILICTRRCVGDLILSPTLLSGYLKEGEDPKVREVEFIKFLAMHRKVDLDPRLLSLHALTCTEDCSELRDRMIWHMAEVQER